MKVGLTGATGFIGSRVAKLLRDRGDSVVCVVRSPDKATELAGLGCELKKGDLLDKPSMAAAFAGCDAVIHMAASYEIGLVGEAKRKAGQFNLDGTTNALEAAHEAGAKRIVYTSSLVVYGYARKDPPIKEGDPIGKSHPSYYSESKAQAHEIAQALVKAGVPIITVQPGAVIGPRDHSTMRFIFGGVASGWPLPLSNSLYGVIDVDEVARGHVLALDKGHVGHCYHLAAEFLTMQQLMQRAQQISGVSARYVTLPAWVVKVNALFTQLVEYVLPVPEILSSELSRSMAGVFQNVDRTNSETELGFEPRKLDHMIGVIMGDELTRRGKTLPAQLSGGA